MIKVFNFVQATWLFNFLKKFPDNWQINALQKMVQVNDRHR